MSEHVPGSRPKDTYRLSKRVSFETAGDRLIVMIDETGELYTCNRTLTEFLTKLDGKRSVAEIARLLHEKYDCDTEIIVEDLRNTVSDLFDKGILECI